MQRWLMRLLTAVASAVTDRQQSTSRLRSRPAEHETTQGICRCSPRVHKKTPTIILTVSESSNFGSVITEWMRHQKNFHRGPGDGPGSCMTRYFNDILWRECCFMTLYRWCTVVSVTFNQKVFTLFILVTFFTFFNVFLFVKRFLFLKTLAKFTAANRLTRRTLSSN